ncbi:MAG: putative toxin-antitoxin system toxin component, PIN family [Candidatus Aminicenantes bacterium]|nr:putative toxin-antitoxin system toxin component, PIN family [Candidatus Aminicenantes bacterium]
MKVVLDTNVIIASFASRGLCHSVFELCLDRFEIIISSYLIDEVQTNLSKKLKLPLELIRDIIDFLSENATLIGVDEAPPDVCKDPEDARLLVLAQKSGAPYLITGDKDLLAIKKYASSKILSPRQFWETVKKQNET